MFVFFPSSLISLYCFVIAENCWRFFSVREKNRTKTLFIVDVLILCMVVIWLTLTFQRLHRIRRLFFQRIGAFCFGILIGKWIILVTIDRLSLSLVFFRFCLSLAVHSDRSLYFPTGFCVTIVNYVTLRVIDCHEYLSFSTRRLFLLAVPTLVRLRFVLTVSRGFCCAKV